MLKICRKCGNKYGFDDKYLYACDHHKMEAKDFPLPKDFLKLKGMICVSQMSYRDFKKRYGNYGK